MTRTHERDLEVLGSCQCADFDTLHKDLIRIEGLLTLLLEHKSRQMEMDYGGDTED